jgi:hypothetical protein
MIYVETGRGEGGNSGRFIRIYVNSGYYSGYRRYPSIKMPRPVVFNVANATHVYSGVIR